MQPILIAPRLQALRQSLLREHLDAMLVVNEANLRYLSGYTNHDAFLFISAGACGAANIFITDFRYTEQAAAECPDYTIMLHKNDSPSLRERLAELCAAHGVKRLAFERDHIGYGQHEEIKNALGGVEFVPSADIIEELRYVKDGAEIERLRKACAGTDQVFADLCAFIKPGLTEQEVEWEIYQSIHKHGFEVSFPAIVVSGARGSLPHGVANDKKLVSGEFLTMDFGCMYQGYHADITRTVFIGQPSQEQRRLYDTVLTAHQRAAAAVRDGAAGKAVDAAARDHLTEQGYGANFGHGLGHGVGLEIHERPFMNRTCQDKLQAGNVITVEPGVYLPGNCGIRVEDTVLVRESGAESLFSSPKELICL